MRFFKCKYIYIFLTLFLYCFNSFSQGGWKKKYHLQNSIISVSRNAIEAPDGNFIVIGLTYDTAQNKGFNSLTVIGTDPAGNILWRKNYGRYNFEYLGNIFAPKGAIVHDQNFFYHTLNVRDSITNKSFGVLIKFNYAGDTLWQKCYRIAAPKDIIPQALTKSVDGGFLISGLSQNWDGMNTYVLLIKTDKNGEELWRKRISKGIPNKHDGKSIIQDTASKRIIIVGNQDIGPSADSFGNLLILDSLGGVILQKTFNNAKAGPFMNVIQLRDKHFLTAGAWYEYTVGNLPFTKPLLVKFNVNGDTIWTKKYNHVAPYNGIGQILETANDELVFLAKADLSQDFQFQFIKADKFGNFKFQKNVGNFNIDNPEGPRSFSSTSDKGFLISTWYPYNMTQHPYRVIKLDSTGCDTTSAYCEAILTGLAGQRITDSFNFEIFPNPSNEAVNIKIDAPSEKQFSIQIVDLVGRVIEISRIEAGTGNSISTSGYKSGLYFLDLIYEGKAVQRKKLVVMH